MHITLMSCLHIDINAKQKGMINLVCCTVVPLYRCTVVPLYRCTVYRFTVEPLYRCTVVPLYRLFMKGHMKLRLKSIQLKNVETKFDCKIMKVFTLLLIAWRSWLFLYGRLEGSFWFTPYNLFLPSNTRCKGL